MMMFSGKFYFAIFPVHLTTDKDINLTLEKPHLLQSYHYLKTHYSLFKANEANECIHINFTVLWTYFNELF